MINQKIILISGEIGIIMKVSNGNYLVALNNGTIRWVSPEQIKEMVK